MSHKEKKKLKKQQEYEKQMELLTKKGGQGHSELDANFTVSQAQKSAGKSRKYKINNLITVQSPTIQKYV